MRVRLLVLACLMAPSSAMATMPLLGEMPKARTKEACRAWAQKQIAEDKDDIAVLWGMQPSGASDPKLAARRLANDCLGKGAPKIVTFGASAGSADEYCRTHGREAICVKRRGR